MTLREFFRTRYLTYRLNLTARSIQQYEVSLSLFDQWHGQPVRLDELSDELVLRFLRHLRDSGRSPRTINSKRQAILSIWRLAHRKGQSPLGPDDVPRVREPKRNPLAWTPQQVGQILAGCELMQPIRQRGLIWDRRHWRALVLTLYDCGERISAVLSCHRVNYRAEQSLLFIPAELRKGTTEDKLHWLHPETCEALNALPYHELLFPWPLNRRALWEKFKGVLRAARLDCDRQSMFHRLRRTGYTYVWLQSGADAARDFCGHSGDLSKSYLDRTKLPQVKPTDLLPRPWAG